MRRWAKVLRSFSGIFVVRRLFAGALGVVGVVIGAEALAAPPLVVDAGLLLARPTALDTGLSTGISAGATLGETLFAATRLGWSTATEYTLTRTVTQSDLRLRLGGGAQAALGPGRLGLRALAGGTIVHERSDRAQAERAGLTGRDASRTTWAMLPAGEVEAAVTLRLVGDFGLALAVGPGLVWRDGAAQPTFAGEIGLAWLP